MRRALESFQSGTKHTERQNPIHASQASWQILEWKGATISIRRMYKHAYIHSQGLATKCGWNSCKSTPDETCVCKCFNFDFYTSTKCKDFSYMSLAGWPQIAILVRESTVRNMQIHVYLVSCMNEHLRVCCRWLKRGIVTSVNSRLELSMAVCSVGWH